MTYASTAARFNQACNTNEYMQSALHQLLTHNLTTPDTGLSDVSGTQEERGGEDSLVIS